MYFSYPPGLPRKSGASIDLAGGIKTHPKTCAYIYRAYNDIILKVWKIWINTVPPPPSKSLDPLHFVFHYIVKIFGSGRICPCRGNLTNLVRHGLQSLTNLVRLCNREFVSNSISSLSSTSLVPELALDAFLDIFALLCWTVCQNY